MQKLIYLIAIILVISCEQNNKAPSKENKKAKENNGTTTEPVKKLTLEAAEKLIQLPLDCVTKKYPYRLGQTLGSADDLQTPQALHPIFYGCFDWHSAVHGYWSMVKVLQKFPKINRADEVKEILATTITDENVATELAYFEKEINSSFERTYGWAWLLKLAEALHQWEDPLGKELYTKLEPLTQLIIERYKTYLPKLVYPIRTGEHPNTAFGLAFAYDYAVMIKDTVFINLIKKRSKEFYLTDKNCPIKWEPSGYDFLSPCLEEIDIMRRVLAPQEFEKWMDDFMPQLMDKDFTLEVGQVGDRKDGKLVHLDGLNFSRAWVLYGLAKQYPAYNHLISIAHQHIDYSYPNLIGDDYMGGHWLGSFAIYALIQNN